MQSLPVKLFEMQEKHKTLGCTLVVTQNHLITLREDFSAPLRKLKDDDEEKNKPQSTKDSLATNTTKVEDDSQYLTETTSLVNKNTFSQMVILEIIIFNFYSFQLSSAMSTPTRNTQHSVSSMNSTPTKLSQLSRSTTTCNTTLASSSLASNSVTPTYLSTHNSKQQAIHATAMQQVIADGPHTSAVSQQRTTSGFHSSMSSVYGKNSGLEILTCADIKEMTGIKIPSHNDTWWCILEFSCQEVRECSDDLVIFFASSTEMQRFLRLLEQLWQAKNVSTVDYGNNKHIKN